MWIEALLWTVCVFFWMMALGFAIFSVWIITVLTREIRNWWKNREWVKAGLQAENDAPLAIAFLSAIAGVTGGFCAVFVYLAAAMYRNLAG